MGDTDPFGDFVGGFESDAVDVVREQIRVRANALDGALAVSFVNAHRAAGAHAVRMKEHHDLANDLLVRPCRFDFCAAHRTDAFDLLQTAGLTFNDVENSVAEFFDELLRVNGADTFDHAAPEIFLDSFERGRGRALDNVGAELQAELRVAHPLALGGQPFAGAHRWERADDRNEIAMPFSLDLHDGEPVLLVEERDALDQPGEALDGGALRCFLRHPNARASINEFPQ